MAPRILIAHPFPDVYGADRVLLDVVEALRSVGTTATVVLPHRGPLTAWLDDEDVAYRCVPTLVVRKALMKPGALLGLALRARREFSAIRQTIAELKPDLIYVNTITLPYWVVAARRLRVPVVVHVHESDDRMPLAQARILASPLLGADRVIAVSNAAKEFLRRSFPRLVDRTVVIYNGIEVPSGGFPIPLVAPAVQLAVIGRIGPNKGQDLAVGAVRALVNRGRDVHLEIAGDTFPGYEGVDRALREAVRSSGLINRVTFAGYCDDVWALLRRTDVVLAPSRTDSLPLVVIEAMLAARPIVAADVGGMGELIEDGFSGLLVKREDASALAAGVEKLIDDRVAARQLGVHAKSVAVDRFDPTRFRTQIVETVEHTLREAAQRSFGAAS